MNTSRIDESKTKHSEFTSNIYFDVGMVYITPIKCLQINNSDKLYTSSSNNTNYNDVIKIIRYFVPTL